MFLHLMVLVTMVFRGSKVVERVHWRADADKARGKDQLLLYRALQSLAGSLRSPALRLLTRPTLRATVVLQVGVEADPDGVVRVGRRARAADDSFRVAERACVGEREVEVE